MKTKNTKYTINATKITNRQTMIRPTNSRRMQNTWTTTTKITIIMTNTINT
jgi:hypothetical protein